MSTEHALDNHQHETENKSYYENDYSFLPDNTDEIDWFEYWMEYVHVERGSDKYYKGLIEALQLEQYALFAKNRFTQWQSTEWTKIDNRRKEIYGEIAYYTSLIKNEPPPPEIKISHDHEPFINKAIAILSEFDINDCFSVESIEKFLKGIGGSPKLALMFGAWTRNRFDDKTLRYFASLSDHDIDFIKLHVDVSTAKANKTSEGGKGQEFYISEAIALLNNA